MEKVTKQATEEELEAYKKAGREDLLNAFDFWNFTHQMVFNAHV